MTPVGLLPAALMGCSLGEVRQGMEWVLNKSTLTQQLIAEGVASLERQDQALYFWPYTQGLETFGAWFQQLWAESLGKARTRRGEAATAVPVPVPSLGPRDQHSTLQQVMEGCQPRWVWILENSQSLDLGPSLNESLFSGGELRVGKKMEQLVSAQAQATEEALAQNGIPTLSLSVAGLSPKTIGSLFFLTELVVGGLGEVMGINAFDQPGVELGKRLTKELLSKGR